MIENWENPEEYKEELTSPVIVYGLESAVCCPDDLDVPSCVAGSGLSAREAVIVIYNGKYIFGLCCLSGTDVFVPETLGATEVLEIS